MAQQTLNGPAFPHMPPNTGDGPEFGDNWSSAVSKINNNFNDLSGQVYDVRNYGAKCDGVTDDSAAVNAAFAAAIGSSANTYGPGNATVYFPETKSCLVNSTINCTKSRTIGFRVRGGRIIGNTNGSPVIDALGSAHISWENLVITTGATNPNVGMQIGRISDGLGADGHTFANVNISGLFSLAALYNYASEETNFFGCFFNNTFNSTTCYGLIQDSANVFGITSAFQTAQTANTSASFNHDLIHGMYVQCTHGISMFVGGAHGHEYNGYGVSGTGQPAVQLFQPSGDGRNQNLRFNMHFEPAPSCAFQFISSINGNSGKTTPTLTGFAWKEYTSVIQLTGSALALGSGTTAVTLNDVDIEILDHSGHSSVPFFDTASAYTIAGGRIFLANSSDWSAPASAKLYLSLAGTNTYT